MLGAIVSLLFLVALWAIVWFLALPLWIAALVTLLVVFAWAGLFVWRHTKAKGAAREIEKTLEKQVDTGSVRPDQQLEIEAMQAEFQKAVRALKSSKLGRSGANALALLPWYLIIGPPGAGKSTALRASGLKFPYLSARGGGVKGVGGTRNCEWWLTNDAVILDTAGRYATEDDDHDEWFSFLDMLQRTRAAKPINGLLVAVSIADVGGETEDGVLEMARVLRERVDEVMSRLQLVLPTYLLFTKCDLLPGFVETFADLRKNDRGQIWGFTLPIDTAPAEVPDVFREKMAELSSAIEERGLVRLGEERQLAARARIHGFPQQLEALVPNLALLVEHLFAENAYQDTPLLRGVYLTSGTQEGRTIDRVMGKMAEAFGIHPPVVAAEPVREAKSYFLRDVFAKVIFPDKDLAVRNARGEKRHAVRRYAVAAACAVVALGVLFFPLRSFVLNRGEVNETAQILDSVLAPEALKESGPAAAVRLEPLRLKLTELLHRADDGVPFALRFGLYQGNELLPHLERLFAARVRSALLEPVYRRDVADLDALARELGPTDQAPPLEAHARYYDALKLHLFVTTPKSRAEPQLGEPERTWLASQLGARWATELQPTAAITADGALFARLLAQDPSLALPRYDDVVQRVRRVLRRVSVSSLALNKLVSDSSAKGYDVTLAALLGGPVPVLKSEVRIPGAFTRRGFEGGVKEQLESASKLLEPWVLQSEDKDADALQAQQVERIRSLYFQQYIQHWRGLLDSVQVTPAQGSQQALVLLQELSGGEPPALRKLFRAVEWNTKLGGAAAALAKQSSGLLDKLRKKVGTTGESVAAAAVDLKGDREEPDVGPADVERAFQGFVEFGVAPDLPPVAAATTAAGAPADKNARSTPLDLYLEQLAFVRDALQMAIENNDAGPLIGRVQTARTRLRSLIDSADVGWRPRLETLLWPPIEVASRSSAREAAGGAGLKWCASVALPFRRTVAGRYPFRAGGEPAALADVAEFFRPNSGLLWGFYNESLKNDIQRAGDRFQYARSMGGVSGFRPELLGFLQKAQEISTALFPAGSNDVKVPLSVKVRPTPRVATVWVEVDGQRFDYRNGPEEWHSITWPMAGKSPGASLRVRTVDGQEETLQKDGEWGLLRLLEAGQLSGGGRDFTVTWQLPSLGLSVAADFRSARSESPFFSALGKKRFLSPLRNGLAAPLAIAKGKPGCELVAKP